MKINPEQPETGLPRLSDADAAALDHLLGQEAGQGQPISPERVERLKSLLGLLNGWAAQDAETDLKARAWAGLLASRPATLTQADRDALDAILALRQQGLEAGPMPAGSQQRAERLSQLLGLLDQPTDEPVPTGLAERTMHRIQRDRDEQKRLGFAGHWGSADRSRPGLGGLRQIATTAALLMMVLSVLLPVLSKGHRDAMIAQCGENLAGLGIDLQRIANDNKGVTAQPTAESRGGLLEPLASFASRGLDGSTIPASRVNLFVLMDKQQIDSEHLLCPSADKAANAHYNGQNPVAGGPLRLFLEPRPIFADTNPLFRQTANGLVRIQSVPGMSTSKNHNGAGQNVLISDGSVRWMVRPAVMRRSDQADNIWLFQPATDQGGDQDVFLTP